MQRRTKILGAALLAASMVGITACSGGGGNSSGALTAKGPIKIWYSNNEQEVAWGKATVASWNKAHPDEKVTGQEIPAGKTSEEVIGASITAGNSPCLIYNTAPSAVGQFEKMGGLVDLSKFDGGTKYVEDRSGSIADQYTSPDGDYYQLPWKSNPVMIFYNKDMFKKAGLDADNPKLSTYADFLATSKKLVSSGVAQNAIWPAPTSEFFQSTFDFYPLYAAQSGGKQLVSKDGKATFTNAAGLDAANFWRTMYSDKLAGQEAYNGDSFADGKAAMSIVGPWAVSTYKSVNWGSVPVPTKDGTAASKTYTFSDAKNVGMYTACKNQGTAWDFLKYSTSKAQDQKLLDVTGQMPIRSNLATTYASYFAKNPAYKEFGDQAARTVEVPAGPNTVAELQAFRDNWSKSVIFGKGSVKSALDDSAKKIDSLASQK